MSNPVLVNVMRGGIIESTHRGAVAVLDTDGAVVAAVIEAFVALDDAQATFMRTLSEVTLSNWNGIAVGQLVAAPGLRAIAGSGQRRAVPKRPEHPLGG